MSLALPAVIRTLGIAFARYIIKVVLGLPSFISMAFTSRHQAVHDVLTRTTVQIRDLTLAVPDDYHEQAHRLKATRDRIEAHETPEIAPKPPELAPERPRLAPDQVLALSRLDDQMTALKARGFRLPGPYQSTIPSEMQSCAASLLRPILVAPTNALQTSPPANVVCTSESRLAA